MATFRTIVGGRASGGASSGQFPRGIELLLKKAKADSEFYRFFVDAPLAAARTLEVELTPTEARILEAMPRGTLETAVLHTAIPVEHVPLIRSARTSAALAMALAFIATAPVAASAGQMESPAVIEESVQVVVDRLRALQEGLDNYREAHGEYPSTLQWLTSDHPLEGWVPRAYLFDPWYRPFRYEGVISGGQVVGYRLQSLGPDPDDPDDNVPPPIDPDRHSFLRPNPVVITVPGAGTAIDVPGFPVGEAIDATATHSDEGAELVWLLDRVVVARTTAPHRMTVVADAGMHELVVQDDDGNSDFVVFEVAAAAEPDDELAGERGGE